MEHTVIFDTGSGNKLQLIFVKNIIDKLGGELCSALPALYTFSGCDCTSSFVQEGNIKLFHLLLKHPQFVSPFKYPGSITEVQASLFCELEHFTCLMYSTTGISDVNQLRTDLF